MLSVEKCKKYLKNSDYTEQQIEEIRDNLYQLAEILVDDYIQKKGAKNDKKQNRIKIK